MRVAPNARQSALLDGKLHFINSSLGSTCTCASSVLLASISLNNHQDASTVDRTAHSGPPGASGLLTSVRVETSAKGKG